MPWLMTIGFLLVCLGGCTPAGVLATGAAAATAVELYCQSTTESGKQALRDHVTAGTPVIACPRLEMVP